METQDHARDPGPAPGLETVEALAEAARAGLPEPFRSAAAAVGLRVVDWPEDEMLDDLGIESAYELTGLYEGIPMTEKSVSDPGGRADVVWLFRRPILDEWADRGAVTLGELVGHVLIHELAHHFGWSDADIAAIDPWWE